MSCIFSLFPLPLPYKPVTFWAVSLLKGGFLWLYHQCKVLQGMQKYLSTLMQTVKHEFLLKGMLLQWTTYNWHFKHISLFPFLFYNPEIECVKWGCFIFFFHKTPFSLTKQIINPMEVTIMISWSEISLIKVKEGSILVLEGYLLIFVFMKADVRITVSCSQIKFILPISAAQQSPAEHYIVLENNGVPVHGEGKSRFCSPQLHGKLLELWLNMQISQGPRSSHKFR